MTTIAEIIEAKTDADSDADVKAAATSAVKAIEERRRRGAIKGNIRSLRRDLNKKERAFSLALRRGEEAGRLGRIVAAIKRELRDFQRELA